MPDRKDELIRDLLASRERLLAVVAGVSEEQFKRRPAPAPAPSRPGERESTAAGEWSIAEVLAHLLAAEQRAGIRIEGLIAGEEYPGAVITDEERNVEARQGRLVPVPQIIHGLLAARRRLERALTEAEGIEASEAVSRAVRVDVIEHESAHRAQIEAVRAVLGAARPARE